MKYSFLNSHEETLSKRESTSSRQAHLKHNKKKEPHFKSQYAWTYMYSKISKISKIYLMTLSKYPNIKSRLNEYQMHYEIFSFLKAFQLSG